MSRLLFAAARGAQIETKMYDGPWFEAYAVAPPQRPIQNLVQRIHPDDAHLQYGPISTKLRGLAEYGKFPKNMSYGFTYYEFSWTYYSHGRENKLHRSLFLLLLSEALADEGL